MIIEDEIHIEKDGKLVAIVCDRIHFTFTYLFNKTNPFKYGAVHLTDDFSLYICDKDIEKIPDEICKKIFNQIYLLAYDYNFSIKQVFRIDCAFTKQRLKELYIRIV